MRSACHARSFLYVAGLGANTWLLSLTEEHSLKNTVRNSCYLRISSAVFHPVLRAAPLPRDDRPHFDGVFVATGTGAATSQGGTDHGAQRSGPRPGNEGFALLGGTGTRHCPVGRTRAHTLVTELAQRGAGDQTIMALPCTSPIHRVE
jgi:hypothetical protein